MTSQDVREKLCGRNSSFALSTSEVKQRLGHPDTITILRKWCARTGRDVVVFTFKTEDGEVDVFGVIGFLNGEETLFDGWVVPRRTLETGASDDRGFCGTRGIIDREPTLFDIGIGTADSR